MLRLLLPTTIVLSTFPAAADPSTPRATTEMVEATDACTVIRGKERATDKCKLTSKIEIKGLGTAELVTVGERDQGFAYAIALRTGGKLMVSDRIDVFPSDCGMMKCDIIDSNVARLRALKTGMVVLEVAMQAHHEYTSDDGVRSKQVITERWEQTSAMICGKRDGALECKAQAWGGRSNSCKVKISDAGMVTSTCTATDVLGL